MDSTQAFSGFPHQQAQTQQPLQQQLQQGQPQASGSNQGQSQSQEQVQGQIHQQDNDDANSQQQQQQQQQMHQLQQQQLQLQQQQQQQQIQAQQQHDVQQHGLQQSQQHGQQPQLMYQQQQVPQQQPDQLFANVNMNNFANFSQGFQMMQQQGNLNGVGGVPFALMGPSQIQQQLSALSGLTSQLPPSGVFQQNLPSNGFQNLQQGFQNLQQLNLQQPPQQQSQQQQPQQQQTQNIFNAQFLQQMGLGQQQQPQLALASPPIMNLQQIQQLMTQQLLNQGQVGATGGSALSAGFGGVPVLSANAGMPPQFASLAGAFGTQQVQQQPSNAGVQQVFNPVNGVNVAGLTLPSLGSIPGGDAGSGTKSSNEVEWAEPFAGKGKKEPPFPLKLHQILSNPEFSECISWNSHGRSWRILKPPVFEQVVIPLYFR
jgi:HSF-type DNA-binding